MKAYASFLSHHYQVQCQQEGERIIDYACRSIDRPDDEQPCYTGVSCQTKFYNC